jgi:hypothetical protein
MGLAVNALSAALIAMFAFQREGNVGQLKGHLPPNP